MKGKFLKDVPTIQCTVMMEFKEILVADYANNFGSLYDRSTVCIAGGGDYLRIKYNKPMYHNLFFFYSIVTDIIIKF